MEENQALPSKVMGRCYWCFKPLFRLAEKGEEGLLTSSGFLAVPESDYTCVDVQLMKDGHITCYATAVCEPCRDQLLSSRLGWETLKKRVLRENVRWGFVPAHLEHDPSIAIVDVKDLTSHVIEEGIKKVMQ